MRYYLRAAFFLCRGLAVAGCAFLLLAAVSRAQSSEPAGPRGEAYEKCKSFFSGPARDLSDSEENNTFLNSCGWKFYDYHELAEGGRSFAQARAMAERRHDQVKLADSLDGAANIYRLGGDFERSEQMLQQALSLAQEIQNKDELSKIYLSFGRLRGDQGRVDEACDYMSSSLKILEELDNPLRLAIANNNLGTCFLRRGDYANALQFFRRSLTALQQINEELKSSVVLDNIAQCDWRLGDFSKAIDTIRQSLTIRERYGDKLQIGKSLDSLGNVYLQQGNYAAALDAMQRGFELRTKAGFPLDAAESLNNIATVYEAQGEYGLAASYLRRALKTADKLGNKDLAAEIDTHISEVYLLEGNSAQAFVFLQHALDNSRAADDNVQLAAAQSSLGRLYMREGRFDRARDVLKQTRDFYEAKGLIIDLGNTLVELSEVARRSGDLLEGLSLAARAKELGERIGSPELRWRSLTAVGRIKAAMGNRDEAAKSFEDAIAAIEQERTRVAGGEENRARFFSERVVPYQERIGLALSSGKIEDALYYAERSKARVLLDVIDVERVPLTTAMTEDERGREIKLRTALASLNNQILAAGQASATDEKRLSGLKQQRDEARLQYEDFESALFSAHPELAVSRGMAPLVHEADAKALLHGRSAAIVEYAVVRNRTWAFVISARGIRIFELPLSNSQLQKQVEHFRQQLATRDLGFVETAREVYQKVLGPASASLRDKAEVVIIPDGVLWDLPFQALQSGPDRYLIEDSAISYAPSLTALQEMRRPRQRTNQEETLLAFGNPTIGNAVVGRRRLTPTDDHLSPLPEAENQAKSVAEVYRPHSRVYLGAEAREDRWKAEAPRYRIVHLATHGVLDNGSPLYSYLVLAPSDDPANPDDGLLEAWEIMRMRLNADLVVLSACETARGRIFAGEAVIGLTWAFFAAGSPAIVVSQWKVESQSSSVLMKDFHQRWKGGRTGLSKAKALQMAAVEMLRSRNFSHPFYWAGYILVGNER